ncbi:MAG: trehalose-phosphatase [Micrococcaceae bacterium]
MSRDTSLESALQQFAQQQKILIALDFDGTLAPFVARPEDARMSNTASSTLQQLSELSDTFVALVSGRNLESLQEVASPEQKYYLVGSHGAEMNFTGASAALSPEQRELLDNATTDLQHTTRQFPGSHVEHKPSASVFHFRDVNESHEESIEKIMQDFQEKYPDIHMMAGNKVFEFAVLDTNKGEALKALRNEIKPDSILFAGDDVTDENGFKVLNSHDIAVKVGSGETTANYRVANTDAVTQLLQSLLELRKAVVNS